MDFGLSEEQQLLHEVGEEDLALRQEVESLLDALDSNADFLASPTGGGSDPPGDVAGVAGAARVAEIAGADGGALIVGRAVAVAAAAVGQGRGRTGVRRC